MGLPFDYFKYRNGELTVENIRLSAIAKKTGTPVYVYSSAGFLNPLRELQAGLVGIDHLICYAVKANSNLAILKLLAKAGAGMDLVSGGELFRATRAKVSPKKMVFSGVGKSEPEIIQALKLEIFSFNVESLPELERINRLALSLKRVAPIALRFNPDVNPKTHPYISTGLKKNKFGLNRHEIFEILPEIKKMKGISLRGLSIHIGSQLLSLAPLEEAFLRVKDLAVEVEAAVIKPLEFLDLGGGLGISYEQEKAPSISDYCRLIQKHFGPKISSKTILLEPGRILSGNSGVLVTQVIYRKERKEKDFLIADAGMNDLLRPALYGSHHDIVPVLKTAGKTRLTDVVGPVCETSDCIGSDREISQKIKSGDLLAILSAGAYGFSMASNYNSRVRPAEVLVSGKKIKVIRNRESYEDLIRGEETT